MSSYSIPYGYRDLYETHTVIHFNLNAAMRADGKGDLDFYVPAKRFDEVTRWVEDNITGSWLWMSYPPRRVPKGRKTDAAAVTRPRIRFYEELDAVAFMARFGA